MNDVTELDILEAIDWGVGYNTVNSINTVNTVNRENKENKVEGSPPPSLESQAIAFPKINSQGLVTKVAVRDSVISSPTPDPMNLISDNNVVKCHIGFYDNGKDSKQQYKLKATIIFKDNTQAEFISSLTKDRRNFSKHLPEESKESTLKDIDQIKKHIIEEHSIKPWIGKFHHNNGFGTQETRSQIEPYTWTAIYYNEQERGWAGFITIYGLTINFDLFIENLTPAQIKGNMKAKETWHNPKIKDKDRPKTWAQRQQQDK